MKIQAILPADPLWQSVIEFAEHCSWKAGPILAELMRDTVFSGWERVFTATEDGRVAGYCTLAKEDCVPGVSYTPYIGFVFVGEEYRGHRLSQQLTDAAMEYARSLGVQSVYLVSGEIGLYEKYGFVKIDEKPDVSGRMEQIFTHSL